MLVSSPLGKATSALLDALNDHVHGEISRFTKEEYAAFIACRDLLDQEDQRASKRS